MKDHLTPLLTIYAAPRNLSSPNHKLPAIVDHDPSFGGGPHAVFESGAILLYLAEKTGKLLPTDPRARSVAVQWLTWQVAGLGPMSGQAAHFVRYAPERIPYAIERYTRELSRLLRVLERRLGQGDYLAGDEFSIADIAVWPSRALAATMDASLQQTYPNTVRWIQRITARPAVQRGWSSDLGVPAKYRQRQAELTPEQWSNMFGDRMHGAVHQSS